MQKGMYLFCFQGANLSKLLLFSERSEKVYQFLKVPRHPTQTPGRILFYECSSRRFGVVAFAGEMTLLPSYFSSSLRAFPAMLPPVLAISLLWENPCGFAFLESSVVETSASRLSASSVFVILSRRFSLCKPLNCLYC